MIGIIAAILTTTAFIPQAIKIIKTKNTKGLSMGMYMMTTTGIFLWLIHGLNIKDLALIGANSVSFILNVIILYNMFKYQDK